MGLTSRTNPRRLTSATLLMAAGVALVVAGAMIAVYPHLVTSGANSLVTGTALILVRVCLAAVILLPIAALVRRLTR